MDSGRWQMAFWVALLAAIGLGIALIATTSGRQIDRSVAESEAEDLQEDLQEELEETEDENARLKRNIRRLRQEVHALANENAEYTSDDYGVTGIVLDIADSFICQQWPRCWDIEAKVTINNNTSEGSGIECLIALYYEDGSTAFEPLWSDYVPAASSESLTFVHYQDNRGPDIEDIESEGCKRFNGPDGGGDI